MHLRTNVVEKWGKVLVRVTIKKRAENEGATERMADPHRFILLSLSGDIL